MKDTENLFGPVVSIYTREDAITDGVLKDVTETAKEAGFKVPVAVTNAAWAGIITPDERARKHGQSTEGRLWDALYMLYVAIRNTPRGTTNTIYYKFIAIMKERQRREITLKAHCGPGDHGEPVITIMLPNES